jgi:ATP-binding cassette subfamily F protein uup
LDIETLELLEQLLSDYPGTIFLVSHDRAFLDNVVTSLIVSEGDGFWREYEGGYEDWKIQKSRSDALTAKAVTLPTKAPVPIEEKIKTKSVVQKLNSKERQELEDLPGKIDALEQEQADLGQRLADSNLYSSNMDLVKQYQTRLGEIEHSLMQLMTRWEALAQKSN